MSAGSRLQYNTAEWFTKAVLLWWSRWDGHQSGDLISSGDCVTAPPVFLFTSWCLFAPLSVLSQFWDSPPPPHPLAFSITSSLAFPNSVNFFWISVRASVSDSLCPSVCPLFFFLFFFSHSLLLSSSPSLLLSVSHIIPVSLPIPSHSISRILAFFLLYSSFS